MLIVERKISFTAVNTTLALPKFLTHTLEQAELEVAWKRLRSQPQVALAQLAIILATTLATTLVTKLVV